jgi:hypothetical protein
MGGHRHFLHPLAPSPYSSGGSASAPRAEVHGFPADSSIVRRRFDGRTKRDFIGFVAHGFGPMKKTFIETWGPLLFCVGWTVLAVGVGWEVIRSAGAGAPFRLAAGSCVVGGAGVLSWMAFQTRRRQRTAVNAKINIWSSGRPGEVLVGVLHTGIKAVDPAGLVLNLDCVEMNSGGRWLLWTSEVRSPEPSGPDSWPFHFSIPVEGPPGGLSTDGEVEWQLRAKSGSLPIFEAVFPISVARIEGPPSRLLPVPPPSFRLGAGPVRRSVEVTERSGETCLRLQSRFAFPGPNPIVVGGVIIAGLLMVLGKMAPAWSFWTAVGAAGGAVLFFAIVWFAQEELLVTGQELIFRRHLWNVGRVRRFPKAQVSGVRVSFSGPSPHFGCSH